MILRSPEPQHAVNFLCKEHRLKNIPKSQFLLEEFCLRKKKMPRVDNQNLIEKQKGTDFFGLPLKELFYLEDRPS